MSNNYILTTTTFIAFVSSALYTAYLYKEMDETNKIVTNRMKTMDNLLYKLQKKVESLEHEKKNHIENKCEKENSNSNSHDQDKELLDEDYNEALLSNTKLKQKPINYSTVYRFLTYYTKR